MEDNHAWLAVANKLTSLRKVSLEKCVVALPLLELDAQASAVFYPTLEVVEVEGEGFAIAIVWEWPRRRLRRGVPLQVLLLSGDIALPLGLRTGMLCVTAWPNN
jgi:hypothetical protein